MNWTRAYQEHETIEGKSFCEECQKQIDTSHILEIDGRRMALCYECYVNPKIHLNKCGVCDERYKPDEYNIRRDFCHRCRSWYFKIGRPDLIVFDGDVYYVVASDLVYKHREIHEFVMMSGEIVRSSFVCNFGQPPKHYKKAFQENCTMHKIIPKGE